MIKLFTIAAGFTFVLSFIAVLAHDSIVRLERKAITRELQAIKISPTPLSEIQQDFKKLAGYKIWLPPLQSQASAYNFCGVIQEELEALAIKENWKEWNTLWVEFISNKCL